MPQIDQKHVQINGCVLVWDGITTPDLDQNGKPKYNIKVVVPPQCPDLPIFDQLAKATLASSKFLGTLPQGGRMPIGTAQPGEFNDMFPGWCVISAKTKRTPNVHAEGGAIMQPMEYGNMLYGGQRVDIIVHCYEYDAMGNKGIAAGLDGLMIVASENAPRQQFGGGGFDTSSAFGGQGGYQQPQQGQGGYQQPQQGQGGYQQPQQGQGGHQQPQQGQGGYQQPQQGQGGYQQGQQGGFQQGQSKDFLPH